MRIFLIHSIFFILIEKENNLLYHFSYPKLYLKNHHVLSYKTERQAHRDREIF